MPAAAAATATIRINGLVEQVHRLPAPQDGTLEVFIRRADGSLLVAAMPEAGASAVIEGATVDFASRADGTHTYRARDGASRTVPRVVATDAPVATTSSVDELTIMMGVLLLLMVVFGAVSLAVARSRTSTRPLLDVLHNDALDDLQDGELPLDPAAALAALAERDEA